MPPKPAPQQQGNSTEQVLGQLSPRTARLVGTLNELLPSDTSQLSPRSLEGHNKAAQTAVVMAANRMAGARKLEMHGNQVHTSVPEERKPNSLILHMYGKNGGASAVYPVYYDRDSGEWHVCLALKDHKARDGKPLYSPLGGYVFNPDISGAMQADGHQLTPQELQQTEKVLRQSYIAKAIVNNAPGIEMTAAEANQLLVGANITPKGDFNAKATAMRAFKQQTTLNINDASTLLLSHVESDYGHTNVTLLPTVTHHYIYLVYNMDQVQVNPNNQGMNGVQWVPISEITPSAGPVLPEKTWQTGQADIDNDQLCMQHNGTPIQFETAWINIPRLVAFAENQLIKQASEGCYPDAETLFNNLHRYQINPQGFVGNRPSNRYSAEADEYFTKVLRLTQAVMAIKPQELNVDTLTAEFERLQPGVATNPRRQP